MSANENEADIIRRCQQGDKEAFNFLVIQYEKKIQWVIQQIVRKYEDARDITQEVFIRAFLSISQLRSVRGFSKWLQKIAVNQALNFLKEHCPQKLVSLDHCSPEELKLAIPSVVEKVAELQEEVEKKIKAKSKLSPKQFQIYHLHFELGFSASEVAVKIGGKTTEKSVSAAYSKIRKKLQQ